MRHGTGYSPFHSKWYGWSHRAIYGFKPGDSVKKGDCAYFPANKEDYIQNSLDFCESDYHRFQYVREVTSKGFYIENKYNNEVPNESLRGITTTQYIEFPEKYGKGEWTAKTWEDAKQMAFDFSSGVS